MPPAMFRSSAKPLSGRYLSLIEREEIALLKVQGHSIQEIGRRLGRAASTISRELRRNAATRSGGLEYRATTAQWHADRSARRPKLTKLALNTTLRTYVEERLAGVVVAPSGTPVPGPAVPWKGRRHGPRKDRRWAKAWSPEQIARRLPIDFPDDKTMRITAATVAASVPRPTRTATPLISSDLPPKFHPAAVRVLLGCTPTGAGGATGRSAELVGVAQPIARCGEDGSVSHRGFVFQRGVRPLAVVVGDPRSELAPCAVDPGLERRRDLQRRVGDRPLLTRREDLVALTLPRSAAPERRAD